MLDEIPSLAEIISAYSRLCCKRPGIVCSLLVVSILAIAIFTVVSGAFKQTEPTDKDWSVASDSATLRTDAVEQARLANVLASVTADSEKRVTRFDDATLILVYESMSGNMLTPENIQVIRSVERIILEHPLWPEYCMLLSVDEKECVPPQSLVSLFYPTCEADVVNATDAANLRELVPFVCGDAEPQQLKFDGLGTKQLPMELVLSMIRNDTFRYGFMLSREFLETNESRFARSAAYIGFPIDPSKSKADQAQFVREQFLNDIAAEIRSLLGIKASMFRSAYLDEGYVGDVKVRFLASTLADEEFAAIASGDFLWASFSILGVWSYMWWHIGSFLTATLGMFEIMMSVPLALLIYRIWIGITYFSTMNLLAVFVILGIGADDIFVYVDAYKRSLLMKSSSSSLETRLDYTARFSSKAIFVTTFTTAGAFAATAMSEIMPIASFGIFASLCVTILFILNVLLLPPFLALYSQHVERVNWSVCGRRSDGHEYLDDAVRHQQPNESAVAATTTIEAPPDASSPAIGLEASAAAFAGATEQRMSRRRSSLLVRLDSFRESVPNVFGFMRTKPGEMRPMERFFYGPYFAFITRYRYIIVVVFLALLVTGTHYALELRPPTVQEEWFPKKHMFQAVADLTHSGTFLASADDSVAEVLVVWGLSGMDRSNANRWDALQRGVVMYDADFDPTSMAAQAHIEDACMTFRQASCEVAGCNLQMLTRREQARCFPEAFAAWLATEHDAEYPLPRDEFVPRLLEWVEAPSVLGRFGLDIGFVDGATVAEDMDAEQKTRMCTLSARSGKELCLRYLIVAFNSTYIPPKPYETGGPVMRRWERVMDDVNALAPDGMNQGFQTGMNAWLMLQLQHALVENAKFGMFICFILSCLVLLLSTHDLVISILSVLTIAGIVTTTMGLGAKLIMGWSFGIAESVAAVIIIGMSVDYCVHLAGAYVESLANTREERTRESLTAMGISITAGAATTTLSAVFLWGAVLIFFNKFAYLIMVTIIGSYIWSIGFFASCCLVCAPNSGRTDVLAALTECTRALSGRTYAR